MRTTKQVNVGGCLIGGGAPIKIQSMTTTKTSDVEKTVAQIPRIVVFNKVDAFTYTPKEEDDLTPIKRENISLEELKKTWMAKLHDDCIFISAREKTNIDELKSLFYDRIKAIHIQRYPYNDFLFQQYE